MTRFGINHFTDLLQRLLEIRITNGHVLRGRLKEITTTGIVVRSGFRNYPISYAKIENFTEYG